MWYVCDVLYAVLYVSVSCFVVRECAVAVCLPRPMERIGRLQFSDLFVELTAPPQTAGVVGTF